MTGKVHLLLPIFLLCAGTRQEIRIIEPPSLAVFFHHNQIQGKHSKYNISKTQSIEISFFQTADIQSFNGFQFQQKLKLTDTFTTYKLKYTKMLIRQNDDQYFLMNIQSR